MSFQGYSRQDIVDAFGAFYEIHGKAKAIDRIVRNEALRDLYSGPVYSPHESSYETLSRLEPSALRAYFGLVDKLKGRDAANEALHEYAHVQWPDGLTVHVTNSEDDPFRVNFHASDPAASDWADFHGSLDGGTWETVDGPEFIYDIGRWEPQLFDRLRKEGFDLDFSEWSDPDEDDHAAAHHVSDCDECQEHWNFERIREHMKEPIIEVAREKLAERIC